MNYLVLQHFSRPPRAAIANAILIPAKVQSHKLEHKGKLEISLPHHGEMVLCCARIYCSDSIRETVSDKLVHLSSLLPKCFCHSDPPPPAPPRQCSSLLWHWHHTPIFKPFDTVAFRFEDRGQDLGELFLWGLNGIAHQSRCFG